VLGRHALLQAGGRVCPSGLECRPRRRAVLVWSEVSLAHRRSFAVDEFAATHIGESESSSTREPPSASE